MKEAVKAIKTASVAIEINQAMLTKIAEQAAKFAAARDAAVQTAEALQVKASRALAMAAVGEGDQRAADALAADLAAAESKARNLQLALAGFAEQEAAAHAAIAEAERARRNATGDALEARFGVVAQEYAEAAKAYIAALRKAHVIDRLLRAHSPGRSVFRSQFDASEQTVPALNHEACGSYASAADAALYSARGELTYPEQGKQGEALAAELAALRREGVPV
jgi:hypothetical protein